jgi:iron complex outermembrane recepter protein
MPHAYLTRHRDPVAARLVRSCSLQAVRRLPHKLPRISPLLAALTLATSIASAQRADTTAAAEADDAFGLSVAGETIGLYSDKYVRGFSPVNAGNLRLDGLYVDRQGEFTERFFADVAVRVGATALETPLPAPSGIADYSLRRPEADAVLSIAGGVASFGSPFIDLDWTVGGEEGLALAAGASLYPDENEKHGGDGRYYVWFLSPSWVAASGLRVTAYASEARYEDYESPLAYYTAGPWRPPRVSRGSYLGQAWAGDTGEDHNYGLIVDRASLGKWTFKLGVFRSEWVGEREVFQYLDAVTDVGDGLFGAILYPERDYGSWSGELQAGRDFEVAADWRASLLLSLRGRDVRVRAPLEADPVEATYQAGGPVPPLIEPGLDGGPDDRESISQLTPGTMMRLAWRDRLQLQLGVQRADYRREVTSGLTGESAAIEERPWMGAASASFALDNGLRAYAAYARGFEDSGTAPSFAENAGEVLPASRTEQWDAGLRWPLGADTDLVASVFRLERPNRALDASGRFGLSGLIRNEGVELSAVSHPLEGLSLVAGLLVQRPRMVDAPEGIGPLAVAIPEYSGIVEVDYEPASWRGFGIGISVASNGAAEAKADNSVETEGYTAVDAGVRYSFDVRNTPVSVRASVTNVTDEFAWEAQDDEGFRWIQQRAFQLVVVTDVR